MRIKDITVGKLYEVVWQKHWSQERYQVSGHAKNIELSYRKHIEPFFSTLPITKVTRLMVKDWHQKLSDIPIAANRALEVLSKLFTFAIEEEIFDGSSPCFHIKTYREKKRKRYATPDEIKKIGELLAKYAHRAPRAIAFLYTILFTGARPRSLERANWGDLIYLPDGFAKLTFDGKTTAETGEEEELLLPPQVISVIQSLPRRTDGLIFGVKMPKDIWDRIRKEAGCPDLWARDLRRTFATVGLSNGVKIDTLAELLNHKSTQTTKIYAKLYDNKRVEAVKKIADEMVVILSGTKAVNE